MSAAWVTQPEDGFWRIGRTSGPIHFADPPDPTTIASPHAGNRFDSPTRSYSVCYFATDLTGCFGETLARFRPDPLLSSIAAQDAEEAGFMLAGEVPAAWRQVRLEVRAQALPVNGDPIRFLDVESLDTQQVLRSELGEILAFHGHKDLDVSIVRGADRRITRWIGQWAHDQLTDQGLPTYAGVRYVSRLSSDWTCWAVFDRAPLVELERRPILRGDEAMASVASRFSLRVY